RRRRSSNSACQSWATISAVLRLRLKPWCPVAQKRQLTAQPACDEMHSVPRPVSGMKTVSTASPAPTSKSHLIVPSAATCSLATVGPTTSAGDQLVAEGLCEVRHRGEVPRAALVDPAEELS